jgi:hypothetical protein
MASTLRHQQGTRFWAIAGGAVLMFVCAALAFKATEWLAAIWPGGHRLGPLWLLYVFAPMTAISTLVLAAVWTRRLRSSFAEVIGALIVAEVLAWLVVVSYYGAWFAVPLFMFWAAGNLVFAPWWLFGTWIGRSAARRTAG